MVNGIVTDGDSCFDHHSFTMFGLGGRMEDYEAQEQEFWRKLEEGVMSRSSFAGTRLRAARIRGATCVSRATSIALGCRSANGGAPVNIS